MNEKAKWTPEPWYVKKCSHCEDGRACSISNSFDDDSYGTIADDASHDECHHIISEADANRIVACVNACVGIPTESLGGVSLKELMVNIIWYYNSGEYQKMNDESKRAARIIFDVECRETGGTRC